MPLETAIAAAVPAAITFLIKITQTGFDYASAPAETRAVRETIASIVRAVLRARERRLELAKICSNDELADWDQSVRDVENVLVDLERLVERARIDAEHDSKERIRAWTKLTWMMRDSSKRSAISDRLTLANLQMQHERTMVEMQYDRNLRNNHHSARVEDELLGPPPYGSQQRRIQAGIAERRKEDQERNTMMFSVDHVQGEDSHVEHHIVEMRQQPEQNRRRNQNATNNQTTSQPTNFNLRPGPQLLRDTRYIGLTSAPTRRDSNGGRHLVDDRSSSAPPAIDNPLTHTDPRYQLHRGGHDERPFLENPRGYPPTPREPVLSTIPYSEHTQHAPGPIEHTVTPSRPGHRSAYPFHQDHAPRQTDTGGQPRNFLDRLRHRQPVNHIRSASQLPVMQPHNGNTASRPFPSQ